MDMGQHSSPISLREQLFFTRVPQKLAAQRTDRRVAQPISEERE